MTYTKEDLRKLRSKFLSPKGREAMALRLCNVLYQQRDFLDGEVQDGEAKDKLFNQWTGDFISLLLETIPLAAQVATICEDITSPSALHPSQELEQQLDFATLILHINCSVIISFDSYHEVKNGLLWELRNVGSEEGLNRKTESHVKTISQHVCSKVESAAMNGDGFAALKQNRIAAMAALAMACQLFVDSALYVFDKRRNVHKLEALCDLFGLLIFICGYTFEFRLFKSGG